MSLGPPRSVTVVRGGPGRGVVELVQQVARRLRAAGLPAGQVAEAVERQGGEQPPLQRRSRRSAARSPSPAGTAVRPAAAVCVDADVGVVDGVGQRAGDRRRRDPADLQAAVDAPSAPAAALRRAQPADHGHLAVRGGRHRRRGSAPRRRPATQPRSTSTAVPSASTSGVSTSKPTRPSTVRPAHQDLVRGGRSGRWPSPGSTRCSPGAGADRPGAAAGAAARRSAAPAWPTSPRRSGR